MVDGFVARDQYLREVKLTFGDQSGSSVDISDLRVQFMVRQKTQQHPDHMYVRVTNLSDDTAYKWFQVNKGAKVQLEAGYRNRVGKIFDGQVMQMRIGKEPNGVDKYFDCMATAHHTSYGFARVNKTLPAGHTYEDIVKLATGAMQEKGISIGHIGELSKKKFPRAGVYYGLARDILRDVAQSNSMTWSVFNNKFQMVNVNGYLPGDVKIVNSNTGMIGMPEVTLDGIVVKMLLDPGMAMRGRININESSIQKLAIPPPTTTDPEGQLLQSQIPKVLHDGIYNIYTVDHDGDTKGQEWYTTLLCIAVGDTGLAAGRAAQRAMVDIPSDESNHDERGGDQPAL